MEEAKEETAVPEEEVRVYDDLTNGLIKILRNTPGMKQIDVDERQPCEKSSIILWEQENSCNLPPDLKNFYLTTDGFSLKWTYERQMTFCGEININSLSNLKQIGGEELSDEAMDEYSLRDLEFINSDSSKPSFGPGNKIFELDNCHGISAVCLVYKYEPTESWSIWLLDLSFEWHLLADNFTRYYRMLLMHQGLQEWQFKLTKFGLSPIGQQLMDTFAPHLEAAFLPRSESSQVTDNCLDPTIFRSRRSRIKE